MVVLCDDNEKCDNAPRPEAHPSLPSELTYELSKLIDQVSNLVTHTTAFEEEFKKMFKVTNALYEWHVTQNHFPDTRSQHRYGGHIILLASYPLLPYEISAASPTVEACPPSFDWNAAMRMGRHSSEMCGSIYDLYINPNDFLDTHHDWTAGRAILLAAWPSISVWFPADTLNCKTRTSLDLNAPMLRIQPESNERSTMLDSPTHTPDTTMPESKRSQFQPDNQPEAQPCSYQDYLDKVFVLETRFTAVYELGKLEHKMIKEIYEWHLSQNHFTEKSRVIPSKL